MGWAAADPARLSTAASAVIQDSNSPLYLSVASGWEIAIKKSLGKVRTSTPVSQLLERARAQLGLQVLGISGRDLDAIESLPIVPGHRDPFDRMLIAKAMVRRLAIITADQRFTGYKGLEVVW